MVEHATFTHSASLAHLLAHDHRRLDAGLVAAKESLRAGDVAGGSARFSEFRDGLEHHIAVEEEILFPAFEALAGGAARGPLHVMRMEHGEIRTLMAEIAAALEGGAEARATPLAALTARLYAHNGKEERILYPAIDKAAREAHALEALLHRTLSAL